MIPVFAPARLLFRLPAYAVNGITVALGIGVIHLVFGSLGGPAVAQLAGSAAVCASLLDLPSTVSRTWQRVLAAAALSTCAALIVALQDPKLIEDATNNVYPIYAKYFSLTEIKQMVAFYKTPAGAKSVTNMPLLVNETMRGAMAILQPRVIPMTENLLKKEVEAIQKNSPAK